MSRKRGLDRYFSPKGFWDRFGTFTVLGTLMLIVLWLRYADVSGNESFFSAFLMGLLSGQALVCMIQVSNFSRDNKWLRLMVLSAWPISFVVILILASRAIAFGFYSGAGISFCFGYAILAIAKRFDSGSKDSTSSL